MIERLKTVTGTDLEKVKCINTRLSVVISHCNEF